jgi:peroxiredoxin
MVMPTLAAGANAPDIKLPTTGGEEFSLANTRQASVPVVAAFFKISCPTCQYAFPYLERIYQAYPKDKVRIVGVSQNGKPETEVFMRNYGVTFPVLLDDQTKYPASNAYGLTNVPSLFAISPAGKIEFSSVGWIKNEIEELNRKVAAAAGMPPAQIFKPGEQVADFKAG